MTDSVGNYEDSIIPLKAAIYCLVLEAPHYFLTWVPMWNASLTKIKKVLHISGASTLEPPIQDDDGRVCLVHKVFHHDKDLKHIPHVSQMECDPSTYQVDRLAVNNLLKQGYEIVALSISFASTGQQVLVKDFPQAM